jgi:hypothetical protein
VFAHHMTWIHQAPAALPSTGMYSPSSLWIHQQQPACVSAVQHSTDDMAAAAAGSSGLPLLPQGWDQGSRAYPAPLPNSVAPPPAAAAVQGISPFAAAQHTTVNPAAAAAAAAGAWQPASSPSHALSLSSDISAPHLPADTPTAAAVERKASALLPPLAAAAGCKRVASVGQQGSGSRRVRQQRISKVRHEEEVTGLRAQVGTHGDSIYLTSPGACG